LEWFGWKERLFLPKATHTFQNELGGWTSVRAGLQPCIFPSVAELKLRAG